MTFLAYATISATASIAVASLIARLREPRTTRDAVFSCTVLAVWTVLLAIRGTVRCACAASF